MILAQQQGYMRDHLLDNRPAPVQGVALHCDPGLAVYRNNYRGALKACLRDTYEKTWSWLGDEAFDAAADRYIDEAPPHSWTLADYGARFGHLLRRDYADDPEIAEIAWLDWTLRRAFDGADADSLTAEALAKVDWDRAVLTLAPTLAVGPVRTNSAAIWTALAEDASPPPVERLGSPAWIRVWRVGLSPRYRTIEALEYEALGLAGRGLSFGALCDFLAQVGDAPTAEQLGALLGRWIADGLICAVR